MPKKKTANMEIKAINHTNIFRLLRGGEGLTKQEIAAALSLSLPTVSQNIRELQEQGLVRESGTQGNTGGRRAKTYSIVSDARIALGLDITCNHVTIVAVDLTGQIIYRKRTRKKFARGKSYFSYLGEIVAEAVNALNVPDERILGVGIGLPALVTEDHCTVFYGKILDFTGATCEEFSRYIPYPTALLNDANAAGFAEIWANPSGSSTVFYLMLSNNIGGSILIDGRIYAGRHLHSGEVGHICIERNGHECYCGQRGCVDRYLAATELSNLTGGNLGDYFADLAKGAPYAIEAWDVYLDHLAITVNTLYMLFDCPVILGGYVGEYIAQHMDKVKARAAGLNTFEADADYLQACSYKTEAIAAGASLHFITHFLDSI